MKEHNLADATSETASPIAKSVNLTPLPNLSRGGVKLLDGNFSIIAGLKVAIEVVVGSAELTVEQLFALEKGSTLKLDQLHDAPLVVRLDGKTIATGSLVVVDENFGIKIDEILAPNSANAT